MGMQGCQQLMAKSLGCSGPSLVPGHPHCYCDPNTPSHEGPWQWHLPRGTPHGLHTGPDVCWDWDHILNPPLGFAVYGHASRNSRYSSQQVGFPLLVSLTALWETSLECPHTQTRGVKSGPGPLVDPYSNNLVLVQGFFPGLIPALFPQPGCKLRLMQSLARHGHQPWRTGTSCTTPMLSSTKCRGKATSSLSMCQEWHQRTPMWMATSSQR